MKDIDIGLEKKRRQKVINFYHFQVYQKKWLQKGFEPMLAPTRDRLD